MGRPSTTRGRQHSLPSQLTSFVGRQREAADLRQLLRSARLVALTGPGGVGKTRLALEVVATILDAYADGVWLVELASVADASLVAQAVAGVLGIRERPRRSYNAILSEVLQPKHLLLVLDNCEHVLDACAVLATELLQSTPQVALLTTSREPLSVLGEMSWPSRSRSSSKTGNQYPRSIDQWMCAHGAAAYRQAMLSRGTNHDRGADGE